jgi:hypothetical protein
MRDEFARHNAAGADYEDGMVGKDGRAEACTPRLATGVTVVALYAADVRAGRKPDRRDHGRFLLAHRTIVNAQRYCDGKQ